MPFVDPDRIEQSDRVQAASFAPRGVIITVIRNIHTLLGRCYLRRPRRICFCGRTKMHFRVKKIVLEVNPSKCEVISMSYPVDEFTELATTLASDLPGLKTTELANMELLGAAILDQAVKKAIANKLHTYHLMTNRKQQLDTHTGFFLLKNAFSLPRLLFLLRSSPCYRHSDDLAAYD